MDRYARDFLIIIRDGYRNWKVFSARSSRKEFWLWLLHVWLVSVVLSWLDSDLLTMLFLAPLIPTPAIWVRRIHDTGYRIWRCFIPIIGGFINIILLLSPTDPSEKRWARPGEIHNNESQKPTRGRT